MTAAHAVDAQGMRTSGHEDRGTFEAPGTQIGERPVGFLERVGRGLRDDADLRGEVEEIETVLARKVRDRHELSLFPQQLVWKARDVAHVDARADDTAPFA